MLFPSRKLIVITLLVFLTTTVADFMDDDDDNELMDFDFNQNVTENEVEPSQSSSTSLLSNIKQKEIQIRHAIETSLKNPKTQRDFAQILPILKYMTPPQKLALAALVKKQVLDNKSDSGYNLNEVNAVFANNNKNISRDLLLPISLDIANLFRKPRHIDNKDVPQSQALRVDPGPTFRLRVNDKPLDEEIKSTSTTTTTEETKVDEDEYEDEDEPEDQIAVEAQDSTTESEQPPKAEELRSPFRLKLPGAPFRRNSVVPPRRPLKKPQNFEVRDNHCDTDVNGICFETNDYPIDKILSAIRRSRNAMNHMFAEFKGFNSSYNLENDIDLDDNRRVADDNDNDKGSMCSSMVKFIRPKKAKATSGKWKFVVNTNDHTQTLRIEKCLNPHGTCSYLTDNYRSQCMQIYNYHRLLTWDNKIGLHMDIFKVPTCCSCHIEGYKPVYPPDPLYPTSNLQPETFPGHEIISQGSGPDAYGVEEGLDPNLIINESQLDAALNFGEPQFQNRKHQQPIGQSPNKNFGVIRNQKRNQYNKHSTPNYHANSAAEPEYSPSNTGLSHFLEAPRPTYGSRTTQRPRRVSNVRRPTTNNRPVYDLEYEASSHVQTKYLRPTSAPTSTDYYDNIIERTTPDNRGYRNGVTKRVNYNYHPIIDFFEPVGNHKNDALTATTQVAQKRLDMTSAHGDMNGWRPVTSPSLAMVNRRNMAVGV